MSDYKKHDKLVSPAQLNHKIVFSLLAIWFAIFATFIIYRSIHWPVVHDGPILLYMVFLADHGMRLYKDIIEVQFPGSLLLYDFERHVFGTSDLSFRLFDLCALGLDLLSMLIITRVRNHWFAAVFGFSLLLLVHTGNSRGILNLGERDFFVASLLGVGVASLLEAFRRGRPSLSILFGLSVALATTIKPTAILFVLVLLLVIRKLRQEQRPIFSYLGWTAIGVGGGYTVVLCYVISKHAIGPFIQLEKNIMPIYYDMVNQSFPLMARHIFEYKFLVPILIFGSILLYFLRSTLRQNLEQQVLLLSTFCGAASYFLQHKGFWYHREPFFFFLFLWIGWIFVDSVVEGNSRQRWMAIGLIVFTAAVFPRLIVIPKWDSSNEESLREDLVHLHALDRLGNVQCLDETGGCLIVALNSKMVMATGYVTDYLYFLDNQDPRLQSLRARYLIDLKKANPEFLVLTNDQWPTINQPGYEKLRYWPEFAKYMEDYYTLSIERGGDIKHPRGYRIYIRKSMLN